jgi:hypothetical protein
MRNTLKEMDRVELVNLEQESTKTISQSLKELKAGERIPIDEW